MLLYLLKRILFFLPTLLIISLVAFSLSVNSPLDPVDKLVNQQEELAGYSSASAYAFTQQNRRRIREQYNLHLPLFYLGVLSLAEPDTLYRIPDSRQRRALGQLLSESGNWEAVQAYSLALEQLIRAHALFYPRLGELPSGSHPAASAIFSRSLGLVQGLKRAGKAGEIADRLSSLKQLYAEEQALFQPLQNELDNTRKALDFLMERKTRWKNYVPALAFYGLENQYHKWVSGILLRFDFGRSYQTGLPISQRIGDLFFWSFMFTLVSVLLAYLISLPLGILGAVLHGSLFDRLSTVGVFAMDSVPSFVVATLLLVLFANPEVLNWFPATFNVLPRPGQSLWEAFWSDLHRLFLPLLAYTYGQIAFISRIMRASMLEVIQQDYIRTARAKGLRERVVLLRHAFRNASLPIFTSFAAVFPSLLGGNVILETIFSIPGMGREIYRSIFDQDIPMIMAVFTLMGLLTVLGFLVSDLLYGWADPRIKLHKA